jgi:hypothetical protein
MPIVGDVFDYGHVRYEIRAIVDGLYVVRLRRSRTGKESYRLWSEEQRAAFDAARGEIGAARRRSRKASEPLSEDKRHTLAHKFGLAPEEVNQIFKR